MSELPTIAYEDEHLFVIEKPANLHSVQVGPDGGSSVADFLLNLWPFLREASPKPGDAGLVQRLDFGTSGLLLGAKNLPVWQALHEAILKGEVHKTYLALVHGCPTTPTIVTTYIGSPHRHSKKMKVYEKVPPSSVRGLLGTTEVFKAEPLSGNAFAFVHARATPARRHQIRLHCAHIGHSLVGDSTYGSREILKDVSTLSRDFFLHANEIRFRHPVTKVEVSFMSPCEEVQQLVRARLS